MNKINYIVKNKVKVMIIKIVIIFRINNIQKKSYQKINSFIYIIMPLKKTTNPYNSTKSINLGQFRTIVKTRANKQTVKDIVNLSATLQ